MDIILLLPSLAGETEPLLSGFPYAQSSYTLEVVRTSNRYILATWVGADLSYSLYVVIILVNIALHIGFIHFSAQRQTMTGTSTCIGMIRQVTGQRATPIPYKMQLYVHTASPYIERRVLMTLSIGTHSANHNSGYHSESLFLGFQGHRASSANDTIYHPFSQPQLRPAR